MVFFPSYRMLEDIYEIFRNKTEERKFEVSCILQNSNMTEREREEFLELFRTDHRNIDWFLCYGWNLFGRD